MASIFTMTGVQIDDILKASKSKSDYITIGLRDDKMVIASEEPFYTAYFSKVQVTEPKETFVIRCEKAITKTIFSEDHTYEIDKSGPTVSIKEYGLDGKKTGSYEIPQSYSNVFEYLYEFMESEDDVLVKLDGGVISQYTKKIVEAIKAPLYIDSKYYYSVNSKGIAYIRKISDENSGKDVHISINADAIGVALNFKPELHIKGKSITVKDGRRMLSWIAEYPPRFNPSIVFEMNPISEYKLDSNVFNIFIEKNQEQEIILDLEAKVIKNKTNNFNVSKVVDAILLSGEEIKCIYFDSEKFDFLKKIEFSKIKVFENFVRFIIKENEFIDIGCKVCH